MSSYGNHVWTPQREDTVEKLIELAADCNDDGFAETLHAIAGIDHGWPWGEGAESYKPHPAVRELFAIVALLAEKLASVTDDDPDEDAPW